MKKSVKLTDVLFPLSMLILSVLIIMPLFGCAETDQQIYTTTVPVTIEGAENIGMLHVELLYDDRIVTPVSLAKGNIVGDGLFSYGIDTASLIVIGIADGSINGDGTIAEIKFKVNGATVLPTDLVLNNIIGRDASTNIKKDLDFINGSIDPQKRTSVPPAIVSLKQ